MRQISEQQRALSWILLKQNKILGALSGEQARRETINASFRSRRQQRALNRWNSEDKPDENLTDNTDKDSDWPRLIPTGSHC